MREAIPPDPRLRRHLRSLAGNQAHGQVDPPLQVPHGACAGGLGCRPQDGLNGFQRRDDLHARGGPPFLVPLRASALFESEKRSGSSSERTGPASLGHPQGDDARVDGRLVLGIPEIGIGIGARRSPKMRRSEIGAVSRRELSAFDVAGRLGARPFKEARRPDHPGPPGAESRAADPADFFVPRPNQLRDVDNREVRLLVSPGHKPRHWEAALIDWQTGDPAWGVGKSHERHAEARLPRRNVASAPKETTAQASIAVGDGEPPDVAPARADCLIWVERRR